jgi:hypothetical protein
MASAKQATQKAAPKPDSEAKSSVTSAEALWRGLLTGWSYNACKSLYFEKDILNIPSNDPKIEEKKTDLLRWLYTYQSLANYWKIDEEPKKLLKSMIKIVEQTWISKKIASFTQHPEITREQFEALFHSIEGIARAEAQYSYYAMTFYVHANELTYPNVGQKRSEIIEDLKDSLLELKNFVPDRAAYSVVHNDIKRLEREAKKISNDLETKEKIQKEAMTKADIAYERDMRRTGDWSALILGKRSVHDILTWYGKALVLVIFAMLAGLLLIAAFTVVGGVLYLIVYAITTVFHIDLSTLTLSNGKDLISVLSAVLTILTGVGVSLSLVVQKTWASLKRLERWLRIQCARASLLRSACRKKSQMSTNRTFGLKRSSTG